MRSGACGVNDVTVLVPTAAYTTAIDTLPGFARGRGGGLQYLAA
jgi:hypothetical protein